MLDTLSSQIAAIAAGLKIFLAPSQVSELRAFDVGGRDIVCKVFADVEQMAARAADLDRQGAKGVYFIPNVAHPDLVGSTKSLNKDDIASRRWLLCDVDSDQARPAGTNATEEEKQAAWNVLGAAQGTLDGAGFTGAVIGDSGNGWHLCYPLDLPNDPNTYELVKAVLAGLHKRCSDTKAWVCPRTFDAPRIWKLYGTRARKGPASEERPHRWARIVEGVPWTEEAAGANNAALRRLLDIWARIDALRTHRPPAGMSLLERARAYVAKEPPAVSGQNGHDRAFHVACVLVKKFGLSEEDALTAIQNWNATCQPPWSEAELRHKLDNAAKAEGPVGELANGNGKHHSNGNGRLHLDEPPPEPPTIDPADVATIDDLIRAGSEVRWLWPSWIQIGVLNAVAAIAGTGKTRFCADLIRRIRHQLPWPDASPMTAPADALVLWVASDNNHDELVTLARDFDIKDSIRLNAAKADPYGGVTLESREDYAALEGRIAAIRPLLVVVDTVGNATDLNLTKQEDAKGFYAPLQIMARRYGCAFFCLTHLNATGHFLGRRVLEKVRAALLIEQPDPDNLKRVLKVHKSNAKKPLALGLTMTDHGNEYDNDPPKTPSKEPGQGRGRGRPAIAIGPCADWLEEFLLLGPARVSITRTKAEEAGFSAGTLYAAKDSMNIEEYLLEGKKWWRFTENEETCQKIPPD